MTVLQKVIILCEYMGGSREPEDVLAVAGPSRMVSFLVSPWVRGLWWIFLTATILLFCGQTSKFIYIDF